MDLGIAGRKAIICGSSRGLGLACATALASEGVDVTLNGIDADRLAKAAEALQAKSKARVIPVQADITTKAGRDKLIAACPQADILVNNNAGPSPKEFLDIEEADWISALQGNMIAALSLIRAVLPNMKAQKFGRIVNITSAMVTTPRGHMGLSSGARAGLTAVVKGLSIDVAKHNVTINNLLPERFDTDRQVFMAKRDMEKRGISYEAARQLQIASIPAGRHGLPSEFGATCAFLCSAHAGFMTGHNVHLDGGAYPSIV